MTRNKTTLTGAEAVGACLVALIVFVALGIVLGLVLTGLVNVAFPTAHVSPVQGIAGGFLLIIVSSAFKSVASD